MKRCWHKWSKWSIPNDAYDGKYQHAICEKCGAITKRKLEYDGSTQAKVIYEKFKSWFTLNHNESGKTKEAKND